MKKNANKKKCKLTPTWLDNYVTVTE